MKDSRIGTYGASALILSFALRAAAIAAIARAAPPFAAALALPAVACISRGALVWHVGIRLPAAKTDGLAVAAGQLHERGAMHKALVAGCVLAGPVALAAPRPPAARLHASCPWLGGDGIHDADPSKLGGPYRRHAFRAAQQRFPRSAPLCALAMAL